jgi:predicted RNA-binding protein YlxR (DUF448 family)
MKVKLRKEGCSVRTFVTDSQRTVFFLEKREKQSRSIYLTRMVMRKDKEVELLKMSNSFYQAMKNEKIRCVKGFLSLLNKDIDRNSNIIQPLSDELINRAIELTKGIEVNLDEDFPEDFTFA